MRRFGLIACVAIAASCTGAGTPRSDGVRVVEVFGPWRDADADRFAEVLDGFERSSGIEVRYIGSVDFVSDLRVRTAERADPPDVAVVPQPAVIRQLAADEQIVALPTDVRDAVTTNFKPGHIDVASIDGELYAVPFRSTVKSLVWYRPDVFAERGWDVPRSLAELTALADRIETTGEMSPWCFGVAAGSATGWAATDWVEDLLVRSAGADAYGEWAEGDLAFASEEVADAFERFRTLVLAPGRTPDGRRAIVQTSVDEAIDPLIAEPPGCAMHRQGDFALAWLPDGTTVGDDGDVDVFVLPGESTGPPPIVIGGTQAVQFVDDPETNALMAYLASGRAAEIWAAKGGFFSLNQGVSRDVYPDDHLRQLSVAVDEAPVVVFDASDLMRAEIGADLLWDGITAWIAEADDFDAFAAALDEARAAGEP